MIELIKNYKDFNNAAGYTGSVRYILAKKKLDTLFVKWLKSNAQQVEDTLRKAKEGSLKSSECPMPFFPPHSSLAATLSGRANVNSIGLNNTITPPRRSIDLAQSMRRGSLNQTYTANMGRNQFAASVSIQQNLQISTEKIPQFYYPEGKPVDAAAEASLKDEVNSIFGSSDFVQQEKCLQLVRKVLGLPGYFTPLLVKKYDKQGAKISKQQFLAWWKQFGGKSAARRAFCIISTDPEKKHLVMDDVKQVLKVVMDYHPGLEFLKSSPQFQQLYASCVVNRMFFMANRKGDLKMTYREFKNSNILKSFYDIESENEINENKDFFSYQDFYVIYIKFWQLDNNHKLFLTKQEFSKYSSYTLSRKTVDRIFSQVGRSFQHPQNMTFADFVWFIYCAQDKTTRQSIEYWFRILDLDGNGVVTGYELEFFFQEQTQRLGYAEGSSNDFSYQNIICQMIDLLKPAQGMQFTLDDFFKRPKEIAVFINYFTDLNKTQAYDQRDPYQERAFRNDHPSWSEWDKFVKPEYRRVENLEENQEDQEVINWENDE